MPCRLSSRVVLAAAAALVVSNVAHAGLPLPVFSLQKQNSIPLGTQFLAGGLYGENALSIGFDGTNAFIGGFNPTAGPASVGVVRVDNAISGTTAFTGLAASQFVANSGRGIDGLAADATGAYLAYDDGNGSTNFLRKIDKTSGSSLWNVQTSTIAAGYRPSVLAIDPKGNNGAPALGAVGVGSGRRAAFDLNSGATIFTPAGGNPNSADIINPNPAAVNGVTLGFTYRGIAFDSQGNIAVTAQGGTSYGIRDTVGNTNFNRFVNPLDLAASQTQPILAKQTTAGPALFVGQGLGFIEGLGSTLLAVSERVGVDAGFSVSLKTATDKLGNFADRGTFDSRNVLIRNVDGSTPSNLLNNTLKGDEDGLGTAYAADVKNIAVGRDANNNPVLLVLDFASKRLDVFGVEPRYVGGSGTWSNPSNWVLGIVPDSRTTNARFGSDAAIPQIVTLDTARTVKHLKFEGAPVTINGTLTLTLAAPVNAGDATLPAYITVLDATNHTVNAPIALGSNARFDVPAGAQLTLGTVTGSGRGLTKRGGGVVNVQHVRVSALALNEGTVVAKPNGTEAGLSRVAGLQFNGGILDLTNNGIVVDYAADAANPYADLKAAITNGAITSSQLNSTRVIGIVDYSLTTPPTFADPALLIDTTSVFVRQTIKGDATLNRIVGFEDLVLLAQNYNFTNALYQQGDFDGSGTVDFQDLVILAQNYGATALADGSMSIDTAMAAGFEADWALAQSLVPEPTTLMLGAAALPLLGRRRR